MNTMMLITLGLFVLTPVAPQSLVEPAAAQEAVPAAWIDYAGRTTDQLDGWLNAADDAAVALRSALRDQVGAASGTVVLRLWIDPGGQISRVVVEGNGPASSGFAELLTGRQLAEAPPAGIRQPLRVEASVAPAAE